VTSTPTVRVALFDISGTLVSVNAWLGITQAPQISTARRRWLIGSHLPMWLAWKMRVYSEIRFRDRWIRGLAHLLKGFHRDQVQEICAWGVNTYLAPYYREDILEELKNYKQSGSTIVLVSNIFQEFVDAMCQRIGADGGIGTLLAYDDANIATGKIASMPSAGPQKVENVIAWLQQHNIKANLSTEAAAYADSISDVPLLSAVQYPNATYPDAQLRAYAQQHQWRIVEK